MSMYFFISRLSSVDSIDIVEDSFQSLGSLFKGSIFLNFLIRNVLDGKVSFYFGGRIINNYIKDVVRDQIIGIFVK